METIYFLSLVAFCLAGGFLALWKVNAQSYVYGERNDAVNHEAVQVTRRRERVEKEDPRFSEYVDWYAAKSDHVVPAGGEDFLVGRAYVVNDDAGQRRQAIH